MALIIHTFVIDAKFSYFDLKIIVIKIQTLPQ